MLTAAEFISQVCTHIAEGPTVKTSSLLSSCLLFCVCGVVIPRNTRSCWQALLSRTLWRNSLACFISWSPPSSPLRQSSSETLETSKRRNRYLSWHWRFIFTDTSISLLFWNLHESYHICTLNILMFSCHIMWSLLCFGPLGSEAAGHLEAHDVAKAQRGCREEFGPQTGDHHWG